MADDLEQFRVFLPHLTTEQVDELTARLRKYPADLDVYLSSAIDAEPIQGDGWRGFSIYDFAASSLEVGIPGIVLSNSCDLAAANQKDLENDDQRWITFAPLLALDKMCKLWEDAGKPADQIENKSKSIREQKVSSMFFLPGVGETPDCVALFDRMQSMPFKTFSTTKPKHVFSLNNYGFYVLLLKISQHFCRVREGIDRSETPAATGGEGATSRPLSSSSELVVQAAHEEVDLADLVPVLVRPYTKKLFGRVLMGRGIVVAQLVGNAGNEIRRSNEFQKMADAQLWADGNAESLGGEAIENWQATF